MASRGERARPAHWVDLVDPSGGRLERLLARISNGGDPTRIRLFHWVPGQDEPESIHVAMGRREIVTWHAHEVEAWRDLPRRARGGRLRLLADLVDALLEHQFALVEDLSNRIARLEEVVLRRRGDRMEQATLALKRTVLRLRQVAGGERDAIHQVLRAEAGGTPAERLRLMESYDRCLRLYETVDMYRDVLNSVLESYFSATSARLNEIVKTLTLVTTVMLPASVIAALYGMNFRYLPGADSRWGFWAVVAAMVVTGGALFAWFRARRWI
jgi:magnesium transporter